MFISEGSNACPPLTINGKGGITGGRCEIKGNTSSQYLSALMMIAAATEQGLEIQLTTELVSRPYVEMTGKIYCKHLAFKQHTHLFFPLTRGS